MRIDTLDNPGCSVEADIGMIPPKEPIEIERSDNNWMKCEAKDGRFSGYGGPKNLKEILEVLRSWIES